MVLDNATVSIKMTSVPNVKTSNACIGSAIGFNEME